MLANFIQSWWIDLAVVVILIFYAIDSWKKSFLEALIEALVCVIATLVAAVAYAPLAQIILRSIYLTRNLSQVLAFFLIWIALSLPLTFLVKKILGRWFGDPSEEVKLRWGWLPAFLDAALLLSVALVLVVALPLPTSFRTAITKSMTGAPVVRALITPNQQMNIWGAPAAYDSLLFLSLRSDHQDRVSFNFSFRDASPDDENETQMFSWINEMRRERGQPLLVFDDSLRQLARVRGIDMARRGYLSYVDRTNQSLIDRARTLKFENYDENVAWSPDWNYAQVGFTDSSELFNKITDHRFSKLGVSVVDAGVYGKIFVQEFSN